MQTGRKEKRLDFFHSIAKKWQSHIKYEFIKGIKLSDGQIRTINYHDNQILINGSAGSGKSIVLLYRLVKTMMEERSRQRILYLTYNKILMDDTKKRVKKMKDFKNLKEDHELHMETFHEFAYRELKNIGYKDVIKPNMEYTRMQKTEDDAIRRIYAAMAPFEENKERYGELSKDERLFSTHDGTFIRDEILWMKANGYVSEEEYFECERTGRGNVPRLQKSQRSTIMKIYEKYEDLKKHNYGRQLMDLEDYALILLNIVAQNPEEIKYDYIFVDEVQDLDAMQLKLLASLNPKALIIAGDPKQRIYKRTPHSYDKLGIRIAGKQRTLYENFRSTKEIMSLANSLEFTDVEKDNSRIKYVNSGESPKIQRYSNYNKLIDYVVKRVREIHQNDKKATIAIVSREEDYSLKGQSSGIKMGLKKYLMIKDIKNYGNSFEYDSDRQIFYTDVYNLKGLEFDHVFLLQFDKFHYPLKSSLKRIQEYAGVGKEDQKEIEEIINKEKKLLYVAMSRAKKSLELLYAAKEKTHISQFVEDFDKADYDFKG